MRRLLLTMMIVAGPAAAERTSLDRLRQGCGFDGGSCSSKDAAVVALGGETERYIADEIDKSSGLSGDLLKKTREGEGRLLQRAIDESPTLTRMVQDAGRNRSWRDYYDERSVDAAVASWGSNLRAGYLKGTAAAYATYKTAPPVVDFVAAGVLWVVGVVGGFALGLLASAFTGHL